MVLLSKYVVLDVVVYDVNFWEGFFVVFFFLYLEDEDFEGYLYSYVVMEC